MPLIKGYPDVVLRSLMYTQPGQSSEEPHPYNYGVIQTGTYLNFMISSLS